MKEFCLPYSVGRIRTAWVSERTGDCRMILRPVQIVEQEMFLNVPENFYFRKTSTRCGSNKDQDLLNIQMLGSTRDSLLSLLQLNTWANFSPQAHQLLNVPTNLDFT